MIGCHGGDGIKGGEVNKGGEEESGENRWGGGMKGDGRGGGFRNTASNTRVRRG